MKRMILGLGVMALMKCAVVASGEGTSTGQMIARMLERGVMRQDSRTCGAVPPSRIANKPSAKRRRKIAFGA